MAETLLICRPQPGADATAQKAADMGLTPHLYPLFTLKPLAWDPPDPGHYDAVMFTSANALRYGGDALSLYQPLPTFAVGGNTARAAEHAGFQDVSISGPNVQALVEHINSTGYKNILHLCGADVRPYEAGALHIQRHSVYRAAQTGDATGLAEALGKTQTIVIHSPRAGECLRALTTAEQRLKCSIIAISETARAACGNGWSASLAAKTPNDSAMLAIARQICNID